MQPIFLFSRSPNLERSWPFVPERLIEQLSKIGEVRILNGNRNLPLEAQIDARDVTGIVEMGGGSIGTTTLAAMPKLRMIGGVFDNAAFDLPVTELARRDIPIVDATRAWGQSVAEIALCLALNGLRRVADWHHRMASGEQTFEYAYGQFCDDPDFANGDLGTKKVGVIGLGAIGGRVARWCTALGSTVYGCDPYLPQSAFEQMGIQACSIEELVDLAEVIFVTVPPTPSAKHLLSAELIHRLRKGTLVVVVTRAHAVDMAALRERIVKNELAAAFDVYDVEPLPLDDPLRGRPNVVHTPHIAGRTKDANLRVADIIASDFARILRGEAPQARLNLRAIAVRTGVDYPANS